MTQALLLAELLCTRLCHDLTGPIGAVNNGAEFLAEGGENMQAQAIELITSSAAQAVYRLQFYRAAYGRTPLQGETSLSDKKQIVADFFTGSKISLDWPDNHTEASGVSVTHALARLLINLIIVASSALIKGGTLSVRLANKEDGSREVRVSAQGPSLKWEVEAEPILSGKADIGGITPKTAQLYLTWVLAKSLGVALEWQATADSLELSATQKIAMAA